MKKQNLLLVILSTVTFSLFSQSGESAINFPEWLIFLIIFGCAILLVVILSIRNKISKRKANKSEVPPKGYKPGIYC